MRMVLARVATFFLIFATSILGVAWIAGVRFTRRRKTELSLKPDALVLPFVEVTFPARDGLMMRGFLIPAATERIKGTIILLHGHSGILRADIEIAASLHEAGYEVLQIEMRGHGRSASHAITFGVYERFDVLGAIDLIATRGVEQVGVIGFSMGGAVAIRTAAETDAVRAIVTDGVYARVESVMAGWARDRSMPLESPFHRFGSLVLKMCNWRLGTDLAGSDPVHWAGRITPRPILLIQGDQDPFVPMSDFETLWKIAGEPKERWLVAGAGHRRANRLHPQEYHRRIIDFFDRWLTDQNGGDGRNVESSSVAEGDQT